MTRMINKIGQKVEALPLNIDLFVAEPQLGIFKIETKKPRKNVLACWTSPLLTNLARNQVDYTKITQIFDNSFMTQFPSLSTFRAPRLRRKRNDRSRQYWRDVVSNAKFETLFSIFESLGLSRDSHPVLPTTSGGLLFELRQTILRPESTLPS
jgi:hypothetical protein